MHLIDGAPRRAEFWNIYLGRLNWHVSLFVSVSGARSVTEPNGISCYFWSSILWAAASCLHHVMSSCKEGVLWKCCMLSCLPLKLWGDINLSRKLHIPITCCSLLNEIGVCNTSTVLPSCKIEKSIDDKTVIISCTHVNLVARLSLILSWSYFYPEEFDS